MKKDQLARDLVALSFWNWVYLRGNAKKSQRLQLSTMREDVAAEVVSRLEFNLLRRHYYESTYKERHP